MFLSYILWSFSDIEYEVLFSNKLIFSQVSISYRMEGRYMKLLTLTEQEIYRCTRCRSTLPLQDTQEQCIWCQTIDDSDVPQYFAEKVKITSISIKKMRFSKAITFSAKFGEQNIHSETIFEKSPLFDIIMSLEEGFSRMVSGWVEDNVIEVISISD